MKPNDMVRWLLITAAVVFLAEILISGTGVLIGAGIGIFIIYLGRRRLSAGKKPILLWIGIAIVALSLLQSFAFYLVLTAGIIYYFSKIHDNTADKPQVYHPSFEQTESEQEQVFEQKSLFQNSLFGAQSAGSGVYEWKDTNIQAFLGDTNIDLNYTVLPKEEAVLMVRKVLGNVRIVVPYDMEVDVHHSVVYGSVTIFDHKEKNSWNKVIHLRTKGYQQSSQRVKIVTSVVAGKLEVVRV
ncbi:cell wall-active antibiotics response protein LiaF [Terribacillus sp. DMT04]|uniref:cell wall-active antibiotics response protein LiaF n=1 Tax=Terribacillus sp. DMT04 TaxID=2850441 RepID=UPI001C2C8D19|nr:cell wall-active antibiotics response protein LiaF [Terribacillus sp. DMT04]QXE01229.1 cell wall-active antibiotics response protein [Terribacillus sp. DMT04]